MKINNKDNNIINEFFCERQIAQRTRYGYTDSFKLYINYTKMHLYDLLDEAETEEESGIRWKKRSLKEKLLGFRGYLQQHYKFGTIKVHFNRIKTFYTHYEIEIGFIPSINIRSVNKSEPITYDDIPSKALLRECLGYADPLMKAIILFMTSSGCARNETLNLTILDFITATSNYHNGGNTLEIVDVLMAQNNVVPIFQIHRDKTNKYYYTFCTPEATRAICQYLKKSGRNFNKGHNQHLLFKINHDKLNNEFKKLNREVNAGQVAGYNKIRSHMLRKFHASRLYNDGLSIDKIDALQGRSKDNTHKAYFKESPESLKELYKKHMMAVTI